MDHALDASALKNREATIGEVDRGLDLGVILLEQLLAEGPGRAIDAPGLAGALVEADAEAAALLAQVGLATRIHDMRELLPARHNFGDVVRDEVLVSHGQQRQVDAGHGGDLTCPESGSVDDMLGMDRALLGHHVPGAVGAGVGLENAVVQDDLGAAESGGLGVGVGRAVGVEVAVERVPECADDAVGVDQPVGHLGHLGRRQDGGVEAHVAVLRAFGLEHVEPLGSVGEGDAADVVEAAGLAGQRLQFLVEADRVALQRVETARRVPRRSARQFRPLDEHHVRPTELGQVVENGAADDATPDDDDARGALHGVPLGCPPWLCGWTPFGKRLAGDGRRRFPAVVRG